MIHILDGQKDEILDYVTLDNINSDDHKKSLEDTLETYNFIAFADKRYSEYLEKRNRLIIPDEDKTLREFVIFEAAKYKDTEGHKVQTFAHASYLELKKASILYPDSGYTGTTSQHGGRVLNDTGWQMGIVEGKGTKTLTINNHTNPYEMLKRIAREFELELRFRVTHNGNKITGRFVDMLERVGQWRGREVEFGKDLDGIRRVEKQDIVTALLGLGLEDEDGNRLEVLVTDNEALKRWGRIDEHGELQHLIEPYEIQSERSEMTETEARQYTRTALNKRINTQITYETTIVDLEEVPGMENKKIRFGDTIKIKDTKFNPPLYLEARVFEMSRSIKSKAKKDIKLGDFIEHTEEEVNAIWKQLQKEIRNRVSFYEMAEYTYDKLTIDDKDETVFEDGKTFAEATGITAEENAKIYADEQDAQIKIDVEQYADDVAEQKAESALDAAKMYSVAKTVYENQMDKIAADMADKADLEYIDGKLVDKVNKGDVYEIEDIDNMINNTVSITKYETDMQGVVTDLESHGTRIGQNADAIGLKADSTDLNAVENSLEKKIGNVEVKADSVVTSVSEVRADLDGLEYENRNYIGNSKPYNDRGWNFTQSNNNKEKEPVEGYLIIENDGDSWKQWQIYDDDSLGLRELEPDTLYTLSFEVKSLEGNVTGTVKTDLRYQVDSGWVYEMTASAPSSDITGEWKRFYTTETISAESINNYSRIRIIPYFSGIGRIAFRNFKLEKGNKATDWSPAPEDTDDAISDVSGRVETLDGEIKTVAGEVALKASQSVVDSLEGRVSTAEGELSVLPGQINAKVSKDGVVGAINATPETLLIDFDKVKITNELEAKHIKSLVGLNVNNQFVVDNSGNVKFAGNLDGATGTFKGSVQVAKLVVDNPNITKEGSVGLRLEMAMNQESTTNPFRRTGYLEFNTGNNGLEINRYDLNNTEQRLEYFNVNAERSLFTGFLGCTAIDYYGAGTGRHLYLRPAWSSNDNSQVRVTETGTTDKYLDLAAKTIYASAFDQRGGGSVLYTRGTTRVRATRVGTTGTYIPHHASSHVNESSAYSKANIERYEENITGMMMSLNPTQYHIKSNLEVGIYDKPKLGLLSEEAPQLFRDETGVDPYSFATGLLKMNQEQQEQIEKLIYDYEVLESIIESQQEEINELKGVS